MGTLINKYSIAKELRLPSIRGNSYKDILFTVFRTVLAKRRGMQLDGNMAKRIASKHVRRCIKVLRNNPDTLLDQVEKYVDGEWDFCRPGCRPRWGVDSKD